MNPAFNTCFKPVGGILPKSDSKDSTVMSQEIISLGGFLLDQTLEICLV